jgi:hypothetical protein
MKIEKLGTIPKKSEEQPAPPWWLGKRAECQRCGTTITLTINDAPPHLDAFNLQCPAPGCGGFILIRPMYDRSGKIY